MEKTRVLIADSDDEMREDMILLLCRHHEVVGAVSNGEELARSAICLLPDVIVTDISTPLLTGAEVRSQLMAQGKNIPFVFLFRETSEIEDSLRKEPSVGFVHHRALTEHLSHAIEAVHRGGVYDSSLYPGFLDKRPEDQNVVLVDEDTLRRAEQMILSCEACNSRAEVPFDQILDLITGSEPSVTEYILSKPGRCPHCGGEIAEKTLVELDDRE